MAHYVFVASAGAYKTNKIEPALVEGDARKESAGHVAVENYLVEQVRQTGYPFLHLTRSCCNADILHLEYTEQLHTRVAALQDLPYTIFQPLYIYGPYTGKDYMPYFLDRLLRNRPVPIPAPGIQLTSLSHVEDVASMLAKVRRSAHS